MENISVGSWQLVFADLLSGVLLIAVILALIIWLFFKNRGKLPDFLVALLVSVFLSESIKNFVNSPRPVSVQVYEGSSFPSTHTALAFTAFFFFLNVCHRFSHIGQKSQQIAFNSKQKAFLIFLFLGAFCVGMLRVIAQAHYITDVIAGMALAFLVSVLFMYCDVSLRRIK